MRLKESFSSHWFIVILNLSLDDIINCKETTTFIKVWEKNIECKRERNPQFGVNTRTFVWIIQRAWKV